jgi:Ca2+-binding RTX toxin-like protein
VSVITGTAGHDNLNGTDAADTIDGLGGNDVVEAGGGDDIVRGGAGYDVLWGGLGGDSVEAGDGGGEIYGEGGNDALIGGTGADYIWDGAGDDSVYGGGGDDVLRSSWYTRNGIGVSPSGNDTLDGGDGNDLILIHRENVTSGNFVRANGGAGRDTIEIGSTGTNNAFIVDAGLDDDVINFRAERFEALTVSAGSGNDLVFFELLSGPASLALGAGADVVRIGQFVSIRVGLASITIEDFQAGAGGDRLDFDTFVAAALTNWNQTSNPFGTGHLRLVEKGQDTILQIDRDGSGSDYGFVNLVTFQNLAKAALTAFNLDGYAPDGSSAGQTMIGTSGADTLSGGVGDDTIDGLGGNDVIEGGGGDDLLRGGSGYDVIWGGIGSDRIEAGDGGGEIFGEQGGDTIVGGAGADVIWDGAGDDMVSGGGGNDELRSSWYRRDEVSISPTGSDTLDGGDGHDLILVRRDGITSGETIRAIGGAGNDTIDIISSGGHSHIVDAGLGDDWVQIRSEQPNSYTIAAGEGNDVVFVELASGPVAVSLGGGQDVLRIGQQIRERLGTVSISVQDFETGAFGDRLDFDVFLANALLGWDGAANPFATGHLQLVESGADTLLRIDRDAGGQAHSLVTLVTFLNKGAAGFTLENLDGFAPSGSVEGRTIVGTEGADNLNGTAGADTIDALGGNDRVDGGGGDDIIRGGFGYNVIWGGPGADRIETGPDGSEIYGEAGADTITGGIGADRIFDGAGDDVVSGGAGNDELRSATYTRDDVGATSSGSDRLDAGDGDDLIWIMRDSTTAGDVVTAIGGAGRDTIDIGSYGGRNAYNVSAGADDDLVILVSEQKEAFTVDTGTGNDVVQLDQIAGSAVLTLGAGADVLRIGQFQRFYLQGASIVVTDFQGGMTGDRLDFDVFVAEALIGWDGVADPFAAGYLQLVWTGSDTLLQIDRDAGAGGHAMVTLVTFRNAESSLFTPYHLDGYTPITKAVGTEAADELEGSGTKDWIEGLGGDDVINTGSGADLLDGGTGADTMRGGSENDLYLVDSAGDLVEEEPGDGTDEVRTSLAVYSLLGTEIENLSASSDVAHDFRGSTRGNVVTGGKGNDLIDLRDGGDDRALGGEGNDLLYFGAALTGADVADGGAGRDALVLQGNVTAVLSETNLVGIESISIQSGANTRFGDTANHFYDYGVTTADGNVAAGDQLIVNAQSLREGEDFTFDGSAESDGRFLIYGGHGTDDLTGGNGADVFFFEGSRWGTMDKVDGGAGRDALVISGGSGLTRIAFGPDALTGIESISLNNRYATDPSQSPSYELLLHEGNVAPGATLIVNGSSLPAGQVVKLDGSAVQAGHLVLFGGGGHDTLTGGDGNDVILGGRGADGVTGGAGADTFRYDAALDSVAGLPDTIGDFQTGLDRIDLGRIDANTHSDGDQAFAWIGSNAFSARGAASAGELRVFDENGYQRIEGDTDGDGFADLVIVLQIGTAPLVQGDFLF